MEIRRAGASVLFGHTGCPNLVDKALDGPVSEGAYQDPKDDAADHSKDLEHPAAPTILLL